MKKIYLLLITLSVALTSIADTWDGSAKKWTNGSGTSSDPYLIESAANLAYLSAMVEAGESYAGKYFKQTVDIDFNNLEWTSIGIFSAYPFSGVYDGGSKNILKFTLNSESTTGLFGYIKDATIKNITVSGKDERTSTKLSYIGGIIGRAENSTVTNCHNKRSLNITGASQKKVGGCIGWMGSGTIIDCSNEATVRGTLSGGICHFSPASGGNITIKNSFNIADVPYGVGILYCETSSVGKIIIENCYNTGSTKTAGLLYTRGSTTDITIKNCYNAGIVGNSGSSWGICSDGNDGNTNIKYYNCYNVGELRGKQCYGIGPGKATNCYNTGTLISDETQQANLIGISDYCTNCYNAGTLTYSKITPSSYIGCGKTTNTNSYYLSTCGATKGGTSKAQTYMQSEALVTVLNTDGNVFMMDVDNENNGYPIFWKKFAITVKSANTTMGTVSGGGNIEYEATTTITATAKTGYHFVKWNDGNTSASRTVTCTGTATYTATFAADTYVLTVSSANTNMGTVTGGGTYEYNKSVTITATPKTGYHFVKWSDGNTTASRSVTVTKAATYTATFAIDTYTLTVTSANTNMGTATGGGTYEYNNSATISATPKEHYHFVKWSDGNTTASRTVTVTKAATYTATFAADTYVLTVSSANTNMGTVTGGGTYDYNKSVTITATPKTGYHFVKWSDGNTNASRSVTVTAAATYTATFAINTYALTVTSANTNMGTVTGGGTYDYNKSVTITATPKTGYHFVKWSDGNTNTSRSVTVTEDATYTATFAIDTYVLTVTSANTNMGTVTSGGTYDYNKSVTITATPKTGYHFVKWNDDNTNASRSVTVTADATYTATFEVNSYDITVLSADESMGNVSGSGSYNYATMQTISATAKEHYHFQKWNDGNTDNPRTITISETATYTALFAIDTFSISVVANNAEMGTVNGSGNYIYGSEQDIEATANYGYVFKNWKDGETDAQRTITVTKNATYTAIFEKEKFSVSISSSDESKGTVSAGGEIEYLSEIQLVATPKEHYHFVKWSDGNTEATRTVTVTKDLSLSADFAIDTFELTMTNSEGGTVTGAGEYAYDETVTLTATPNEHYSFVQWSDGDKTNPRQLVITKNLSLTAEFIMDEFTLSCGSIANGVISGEGTYAYGTNVNVLATPNAHYHFVSWNDGITDNPRKVTVTGNISFSPIFEIDVLTVTFIDYDGTPLKSEAVEYGKDATAPQVQNRTEFIFTGWNKAFTNVTENLTVTALYTEKTKASYVALDNAITTAQSMNEDEFTTASWTTLTTALNNAIAVDRNLYEENQSVIDNATAVLQNAMKNVVQKTFSVTFMANEKTISRQTVKYAQAATTPQEPTKLGHTFVGWDSDYSSVTSDMTITAIFEINTYTVMFLDYDGSNLKTEEVDYNQSATEPEQKPTRVGYNFTGWDKTFKNIREDLIVTAVYSEKAKASYIMLDRTITSAEALNESDYEDTTWTAMLTKLLEAKTIDRNLYSEDQSIVNQANNSLQQAINGLKLLNKSNLVIAINNAQNALSKAEGKIGDEIGQYPQSSVDMLTNIIQTANTIYSNSKKQAEIDEQIRLIEIAIQEFSASINKKIVTISDLMNLIEQADLLLSSADEHPGTFSLIDYMNLFDARNSAENILDKGNPSESSLLLQAGKLEKVIAAFQDSFVLAIDDVDTSIKVYARDNVIYVEQSLNDAIYVYTVAGKLIYSVVSPLENTMIPVSMKGVYFVKIGEKTFKTIVK